MSIVLVNIENFEDEVIKSSVPVIVYFYGKHCPKCTRLKPTLEKLSDEFPETLKIVAVDAHKCLPLSDCYDVIYIPTMIMLNKGKVIDRLVGNKRKDWIVAYFRSRIDF